MARIDLHLHTVYSDGSYSPHDVVGMAHQAGVTALAITDHDSTDGLPEALTAASAFDIEVIPGIEISSRFHGKELHILGYFVEWQDPAFQNWLIGLRESRHGRNPEMIRRLSQLGLSLTYDEVKAVAGLGSIGRPHIAQVMLAKGYVASMKEAFDRYLGDGAAAFVPRELPDAAHVIAWIRKVGGVAVLAHPSWVKERNDELLGFCRALKDNGLHGLEVFYSTHTARQTSAYLTLAKRLELLITGGSDFHGLAKPDVRVGVGRGNLKVSATCLDKLRTARSNPQC